MARAAVSRLRTLFFVRDNCLEAALLLEVAQHVVDGLSTTAGRARGRPRRPRRTARQQRPAVRGSAMNPVDHPHGGGEGKSKGGRHPVTPWGVPTLGKRTRAKHKESNNLIVRGRRRGKDKR